MIRRNRRKRIIEFDVKKKRSLDSGLGLDISDLQADRGTGGKYKIVTVKGAVSAFLTFNVLLIQNTSKTAVRFFYQRISMTATAQSSNCDAIALCI